MHNITINQESWQDFMSLNEDMKPVNYSITRYGKIAGIYDRRKSDGRRPFVMFHGNGKIRLALGQSNTEKSTITEHELDMLSELLN